MTLLRPVTANELVALARTFDLPVLFFFLPPDDGGGRLVTDDSKGGLPWEYLLLVVLLGHRGNFLVLADRTANWAQLLANGIDIPRSDISADSDMIIGEIAGVRRREPLLPEDVLAAVLHGLAARQMRGAPRPGDDVATMAANLRGLADALTAFTNYRPGEFVDERVVAEVAEVAEQRKQRERRRRAAAEAAPVGEDDDE